MKKNHTHTQKKPTQKNLYFQDKNKQVRQSTDISNSRYFISKLI